MALYVDGFPIGSKPSQGGILNPAASTPFRIGSKVGIGDPLYFAGVIDEPAVYRRALTAIEVDDLVAAGPNGKCTAVDGLVGPGLQVPADRGGVDPVVSPDGRYVLFRTRSTDVFPVVSDPLAQTPGVDLDLFDDARDDLVLLDTKNTNLTSDDTVELVSVDSDELGGRLDSSGGALTPNATHIAFSSISDDLVAGDTIAGRDLFVRNRLTGTTQKVSVRSDGSQPVYTATGTNNDNRDPSISDAGTVIAFASTTRDLAPEANPVPGDTWQTYDIYVRDVSAADPLNWVTERITVGIGNVPADGSSSTPIVSPDGRYVWFSSAATNLVRRRHQRPRRPVRPRPPDRHHDAARRHGCDGSAARRGRVARRRDAERAVRPVLVGREHDRARHERPRSTPSCSTPRPRRCSACRRPGTGRRSHAPCRRAAGTRSWSRRRRTSSWVTPTVAPTRSWPTGRPARSPGSPSTPAPRRARRRFHRRDGDIDAGDVRVHVPTTGRRVDHHLALRPPTGLRTGAGDGCRVRPEFRKAAGWPRCEHHRRGVCAAGCPRRRVRPGRAPAQAAT